MTPLVSVVIPTYNRARDLERALKSVVGQTYSSWETIVVDNHSSDETDDLVNSFREARIKLIKIRNNGVVAASRNLGIRHAAGEYVAFLDSDDWWMSEKLTESIDYLERGADVVYHDMFLVKRYGQIFFWRGNRGRDLKSPVFQDLIVNGNALMNSSVVARKRVLQAIGSLSEDPALIAIEDCDAWLRIARITDRFTKVPKTLGYYWVGGEKLSSPERTLVNLDAFEKRYPEDFNGLDARPDPWWRHYSKGRAHYLLGDYSEARNMLGRIRWRRVPPMIAVKTLWMLLMSFAGSRLRL